MKARRGQNVLEYVIVFAAIIVVILVVARTAIKPGIQALFDSASSEISDAAGTLGSLN